MEELNNYALSSGEMVNEEGKIINVIQILADATKATPVATVDDAENYAPKSGRILGEDGKVYNLVPILQAIAKGGGEIDLSEYAKKSYVDNLVGNIEALLANIDSGSGV